MSTPMTYRCPACGYSFGPVGVLPYVPDAPEHQLFLYCQSCHTPQARMGQTAVGMACSKCGEQALMGLVKCPGCGGDKADWGP